MEAINIHTRYFLFLYIYIYLNPIDRVFIFEPKGVLDSLANRAIAQGTNAWTDVDHTCYTITTAGSKGFLNLLPIYVDHILYPTLTETGYHTEVHHINGKGEDAGVSRYGLF